MPDDLRPSETPPRSVADHAGEHYLAVLGRFHAELRPRSYLEVGSETGSSFSLAKCPSIAIDPNFQFGSEVLAEKPFSGLYRMTSDTFFADHDPTVILGRPIDMAFLDGLHRCEYLLRDFFNTERHCRQNSVIIIHDCIPVELAIAERNPGATPIEPHRDGWWAGDVWRTLLILKKYRKDLKITAIDSFPTGLVIVTNLNPQSSELIHNYSNLVAEMLTLSLQDLGFSEFFDLINLESTAGLATSEQITGRFWL